MLSKLIVLFLTWLNDYFYHLDQDNLRNTSNGHKIIV